MIDPNIIHIHFLGEDGVINSDEAQINRTTTVGAFPRGAAECGADDMGGNVLE